MTVQSPLADVGPESVGASGIRFRQLDFTTQADCADAPLTWAQEHMLGLIRALEPLTQPVNLGYHIALREGVSPDEVIAGLDDLMRSHEALRTTYLDTEAGPQQRIANSGSLTVAIVECDEQVGEKTASAVHAALADRAFDLAAEWPIRVGVVTGGGEPRYLAFALCHLFLDTTGARWINYHLRSLLSHVFAEERAPRIPNPMRVQAQWESSPTGTRHGSRGVAQHLRTFGAMPQTMLPRPLQEVPAPRYRYLEFTSPALAVAVPFLAAHHDTSPATVLFGAIAGVSGFVSTLPRAYLQLTVGNRIEPRVRNAVGMYTQDVPVEVDLTDASVADVIDRATPVVLQAARFGMHPPLELEAARRRIEARRGIHFDLSCWLNFVPMARLARTAERPNASVLAQARADTRWRWVEGTDNSTSTYFVFADGNAQAMVLTLIVDCAVLAPQEAVAWVHAIEAVLCESTARDVAVAEFGAYTDLSRDPRGDGWCLTDANWVRLPDVADLVRGVSGSPRAEVFAVPSAEGERLRAFIPAGSAVPDLAELHAACVARLAESPLRTAMAPHEYVVCSGPARGSDAAGWERLPVLAAGTGRTDGDATIPEA
ncbi:hypothetical protein KDL01_00805 [Actinospica durhamensis]|uniref:Condensation domain-containing protein n=1 Tax=Actinospica durhamensis TaxID=1508375 RepID=A0A941IQZ4_9ACTN|nr:condensation domain-containing protein [Actinospica durhamensis]MBR7831776.1 hypothetical protein [Actinospica durhamensis]